MKGKLQEWEAGHAELEKIIASMTKDPKKDDPNARAAKAMLFVMPGFTRAMDYERGMLALTAKRMPSGRSYNSVEELNDHLFVMANAFANMVISVVVNAIPCDLDPVCESCLETRMSLLRNIVGNIASLAASGIDRPEVPDRFHS